MPHSCAKISSIMCSVNLEVKMAKLWLGVSAKATILVSHMHPKDMLSRAYPNYMKMDKIEGLVVVLETSKRIHHEENSRILSKHQILVSCSHMTCYLQNLYYISIYIFY